MDTEDKSQISDGYHTFAELYDHRNLLWINLCLRLPRKSTFWLADHYPGWDLLVHVDYSQQTQEQPYLHGQMSYHVESKYRHLYESKLTQVESYSWDGHTSADVLKRLYDLANNSK